MFNAAATLVEGVVLLDKALEWVEARLSILANAKRQQPTVTVVLQLEVTRGEWAGCVGELENSRWLRLGIAKHEAFKQVG